MEKEARKFKTTWKKVLLMSELPDVLRNSGFRKPEDLYPAVGFGKIAPRQILSALFPDLTPAVGRKNQALGDSRRCAKGPWARRIPPSP